MKTKNLLMNLVFLIIGFASSYFFYQKTKIDTIESQLSECKIDYTKIQAEYNQSKEKEDKLSSEKKVLEIDKKYNLREIESLTDKLEKKKKEAIELEDKIKLKNKEIIDYFKELQSIAESGMSKKVREEMENMTFLIDKLNNDKDELNELKDKLEEEVEMIKKDIELKQKKIDLYEKVEVPKLEKVIENQKRELEKAIEYKKYINIRASIENIEIAKKENAIEFELLFDQKSIDYFKSESIFDEYTFSPTITNLSEQIALIPQLQNFKQFTKGSDEIKKTMQIIFPVSNFELKTYKKGSKGVNLSKGDKLEIEVKIDELDGLVVAKKTINIK